MTAHSAAHEGGAAIARPVPAVAAGVVGGLVGGVVFGMLMQGMGMMPMVAMLVGRESVGVGWLVHLAISAFAGAVFALLLGRFARGLPRALLLGVGYGIVWWVVGALVIMPAALGMTDMVLQVGADQWQSLMGHVIFGLLLGGTFALLAPRLTHR